MQRSPGTYTAGTIYGQIGTNKLVGAGTSWMVTDPSGEQVSNVAQYDELAMPGQRSVRILSIDDDQHITLDEPLPFGIQAGSAYVIVKRTVSPTNATQGALQKLAAFGTAKSPRTYEAFDNGVSAFQLGFADDGRIQLKVGATGADGSAQNPWRSSILIDPATGNVSATGLAAGGGAGTTFNHILLVATKPPNSFGADGDLAIDFLTGFTVYGPKAGGVWPAGIDMLAGITDSVIAASASADLAQAWAITPDNTDVPGAPAGGRSAMHFADKAAGAAIDAAGSKTAAAASAAAAYGSAASAADAANQAVSGKANKGVNTDITSIGGLTTALSIGQGGTGAKTALAALAALGAQASLGYVPARSPTTAACSLGGLSDIPTYKNYIATVDFTATATNFFAVSNTSFANSTAGSAPAGVILGCDLLDVPNGAVLLASGETQINCIAGQGPSASLALLIGNGLVVGRAYRLRVYVYKFPQNTVVALGNTFSDGICF